MARKQGKVGFFLLCFDGHRRAEPAVYRKGRALTHSAESNLGLAPGKRKHITPYLGATDLTGDDLTILANQTQPERDQHRLLAFLPGGGRDGLFDFDYQLVLVLLVVAGELDRRRSCLLVPQRKLGKIGFGRVLEAFQELFDRCGLAIMAIEIQVHAASKAVAAEQGRKHAHDLGALFIDRRRIEIVDLAIFTRAHWMGQRTRVFWELAGPKRAHIADALHRP